MTEQDEAGKISERTAAEAIDELMDHVASLLESQMRTADRHLRSRAARLLAPRSASGTGTAGTRFEERSSSSADAERRTNISNGASGAGAENG